MPEDNRFRYSNFAEVYGKLRNVYRVRRNFGEKFLPPAVLLFLVVFGVITYIASRDAWAIPCCIVIPVFLFCMAVWQLFTTRRDELRIYENGFTYQSGKKLQSCLWTEIETYTHRELNNREITALADGEFPLASIEKKNGEQLAFESDVPGTPEIIAGFESRRTKSKRKEQ